MMALGDINFNGASCKIPTPNYFPVTTVVANSLRRFVTPLDAIRIQGNTARNPYLPSILGRIISINPNLNDRYKSPIPLHPDILRPLADGPFILMQLILTGEQLFELNPNTHWQILFPAIGLATQGLEQVSRTNSLIWVEACQIKSIIAVFHT